MKGLLVLLCLGLCGTAHGFFGRDRRPAQCEPNPCQNGGQCVPMLFRHVCRCERYWTGWNCDTRVTFSCNGASRWFFNPCRSWVKYVYGTHLPTEDETQFIECDSGDCIVQQCPHRYYYDPDLAMCIPPEDNEDDQGTGGGDNTGDNEEDQGAGDDSTGDNEDEEGGTNSSSSKEDSREDDQSHGSKSKGKGKGKGKGSKSGSGSSSKEKEEDGRPEDDGGKSKKEKGKKGKKN